MSALFILATGWTLVGAVDVMQTEIYNRYEKGVVTEDTVLQSPAVSTSHCAILCQQQDGCEGFTFEGQGCRGHRIEWTSSATGQSTNGDRLFVNENAGPCSNSNYNVIDDVRKDVNNSDEGLCDDDLTPGWYRFLLNGTDAVIPTYCVPKAQCGTHAAYWLDLQGGELPAVGHETAARACGHWTNGCCAPDKQKPLTVRNCGAFYLYNLEPTPRCFDAYCVERMKLI
ncbi:von Willebrand factor D and EGF domain-containing protein-like [Littorina saxatilis]|uniref:von Willebrand factor D and EGF domain-containing protein-like n=1 Tax=Littorina saxatilis TaxID=31220 RepID=UPI0038B678FA